MKEVFIKYNPYKLETEIKVNGKGLAQNSKLAEKAADGSRLQEWIEELPGILIGEFNDKDFDIKFHGTLPDYEDLTYVFTEAFKRGKLTAKLDRKPAKETSDKEILIDNVFKEIQGGPFKELRTPEIINAFKNAKSSDFEVSVVATMSSGKSTLINAMLATKLMPSKVEACTAIITKIKDCSQENVPFKAKVYNKDNILSETNENLTYDAMVRLNSDKNVSVIEVIGNIPFVSSTDVSLVLIDTPGPNNSRNPEHKKAQSEFLGKSSKALVLYIMTGEYGTDDDNALLKHVADSMKVGGKQSKDRFIFVVNKFDGRQEEDGPIDNTLNRVRNYLKTHDIVNPNLFPAAALPALNIRQLMTSGANVDVKMKRKIETQIMNFNDGDISLNLEAFATLPQSIKNEINERLKATQENWNGEEYCNPEEALIHTGVVSIEAAIRQYVQKYAKTAKIKNIVDVFMRTLDEVSCFEETKKELSQNQDKSQQFVKQIESIRKKMSSAEDAKKFKSDVEAAVVAVDDTSKEVGNGIIQKFQARITKQIDDLRGQKLQIDKANAAVEVLIKFAEELEPEFEAELDELLRNNLIETSSRLLNAYKQKLASLSDELDINNSSTITINPLKLMGGSADMVNFSINDFIEEEEVKGEDEYVRNTSKKWYKPWTWASAAGFYRETLINVKSVPGDKLAQGFLQSVQAGLHNNGDAAEKYAYEQSKNIAASFNIEFKKLDDVLKKKLAELDMCATDKKGADDRIEESERKLAWLGDIQAKVESILEI